MLDTLSAAKASAMCLKWNDTFTEKQGVTCITTWDHRFGEAGTDNLVHAVGEVKCYFLNQQTDGFRYLLQDACNLLCLGSLHIRQFL